MLDEEELVEEFRLEAEEMFEQCEQGLLKLEGDDDFQSHYYFIFRALHSLKGASGMFGLDCLQEHMHKIESLFETKKSHTHIDSRQIDYLLKGIDVGRKLLGGEETSFDHLSEQDFIGLDIASIDNAVLKDDAPCLELNSNFVIFSTENTLFHRIHEFTEKSVSQITVLNDRQSFVEYLEINELPTIVFIDIEIENIIDLIKEVKAIHPSLIISILNQNGNNELALQCINGGAYNVIDSETQFEALCEFAVEANRRVFADKLFEKVLTFVIQQYNEFSKVIEGLDSNPLGDNFQKEFNQILEDKKKLR